MSDYQGNIIIKNPATPTGPASTGRAPGMWKLNEVAYWIKQGVWPNPAITPDIYFPYVSLLLSTTSLGNANNNLFVDSSGAFNPVSRNGNTTQGSFTPYSTNWSNYFNGNGNYLGFPSNAALQMGSGDFTVEAWIYLTSYNSPYGGLINTCSNSGSANGFSLILSSSGQLRFFSYVSTSYVADGATIPLNQWVHVAATRSSGTLRLFYNGAVSAAVSNSDNFNGDPVGGGIGGWVGNNSGGITGYISNARIVKGTAVYTGAFTPPTSPLTAISGTSLLTCQSNRFRDASTNNFTITAYGTPFVQDFNPFSPAYPGAVYNQSDITNWSGYLNGSSYWTVPTSTALDVWDNGSGSFTVEAWIFATASIGNNVSIVAKAPNNGLSSWSPGWAFQVFNGYLNVNTPSDTRLFNSNTTSVPLNQWVHCALVKSGSTVSIYQNGVRVGTTTNSTAYSNTTDAVAIGVDRNFAGSKLTGYVSNVRMVKGTAVYDPTQSTLTVPTTNLTAVSGTSLLTLQSAAFTDNSGNNYLVNSTGSPTVTGNSPVNTVGYWSNYFDGSGDYLSLSSNAAFDCGTGNWTIEGWVNVATRTTNYPLFFGNNRGSFTTDALALTVSNSDSASYNDKFVFAWGSGGFTSPSAGNAYLLVANATNSVNTWYHFAVVRNGTSIKMYRNGTEVASATISSGATFNWGFNGVLVGGGNWDGANGYINGYISNLRLVKGTAVYTAAFTPPTSPLTAISGTSLLTCQNGRYIDNSTNAFTVTRNGDVTIQSFDPFYTSTMASNGGSMYFSSTSTGSLETILTVPASNTLDIGAGDFTLECWAYATSVQNYSRVVNFNNTWASAGAANLLFATDTQKITFASYDLGGTLVNADSTYVLNTWYHIAVTRASNVFSLYINGVKQAATYSSSSRLWATTTPTVYIGNGPTSVGGYSPFQGYITDTRIIKGSAIYTASFTPPSAPLTPTPATTLLVNGMNAGIYDATTINDLETVGNAQVRYPSPFAPANYYAGAFDGSGDYLTVPYSTALQLPGDFTIEAWVYLNSRVTSFPCIVANYSTYAANGGFALFAGHNFNTTKYTVSFNGSFPVLTSSSSIVYGAWTHVAVVRSGSTLTLYINGVSEATATNSATVTGTGDNWWIATSGDSTTSSYINGSISNLRVVKGTAVYTSNFTPSTTPLTAISGTSLLTCQNKTFIDNSTNAIAITSYGNATAGAISPFAGTGGTSVYFDGSGDYLVTYRALNLRMGAGNITAECWIYPTSKTGWRGIFCKGNNSSQFEYSLGWEDSVLTARLADNGSFTVTDTVTLNAWNHIAYVRNGTNFTVYINGTAQGTATSSTSFVSTQNNEPFLVGYYNFIGNDAWFQGYIDDLRVTKGVARYTANFTPPTQAFPTY